MRAILIYHSVDDTGSPISVSPEAFEGHRRWLVSGRVRVLPLAEMVHDSSNTTDAVAVTFDDGFKNTLAPIERLLGEGVPITVFAVTGHVGLTNDWGGRPQHGIPTLPLMSWDDLERLVRAGASVESHTKSHADLRQLSSYALSTELNDCRATLKAKLGVSSTQLAYPFGGVNAAVARTAAKYYQFGHTTEFRMMQPVEAPMLLPRLDMYYFKSPGRLAAWGTREFELRIKGLAWRRKVRSWLPKLF